MLFTWDLDKTYLKTQFGSLRALMRTALEKAEDKQSFPGARALLQELGRIEGARIHFVSGSPRQMRRVIERKFKLDGIRWDRLVLKPNLSNVLRGRFRAVREQLGYKLPVLVSGRKRVIPETSEFLFGDDAELDPLIYSLYADVLARRIDAGVLDRIAERLRLYPEDTRRLLAACAAAPHLDPVRRIFIHLAGKTSPSDYLVYGPRLVPISNYLQAAAVLLDDGVLDLLAVTRIANDMLAQGVHRQELLDSLDELSSGSWLRKGIVHAVQSTALRGAVAHVTGEPRTPDPLPAIDYLTMLRVELNRTKRTGRR